MALLLAVLLLGCGFSNSLPNSPEYVATTSVATTSSNTAASVAVASSAVAGGGTLAVSFTPVDYGGNFAPRNVYAVWITDASGKWVANLGARAQTRVRDLTQWRKVYSKTPVKGVDGVTGATASSYSSFSGTWSASQSPQGTYTLHMEFTSDNGSGPHDIVSFSTANGAFTTSNSFTYHKNVSLKYTP